MGLACEGFGCFCAWALLVCVVSGGGLCGGLYRLLGYDMCYDLFDCEGPQCCYKNYIYTKKETLHLGVGIYIYVYCVGIKNTEIKWSLKCSEMGPY